MDGNRADEIAWQRMLDCMPVGAMLVDYSGRIGYVNQTLADILHFSAEELLGQPLDKLLPDEVRGHHAQLMAGYLSSPRQRQMGQGRSLFALKKDGGRIPIEIGLNPIQMSGGQWIMATLMDVSARVQAEQMFRQSVNVAPNGVLVVGEGGDIQLVNKCLCQTFGYSEAELIGQSVEMLLPARYRSHHHLLRRGYAEQPEVRAMGPGRDLTAQHKDGREFPVEIGLSPFDEVDGERRVMVSIMDITERKRAEMELKETNINLEEFTYVASHDLRSPLRGIADLLQWIREDLAEPIAPDVAHNLDRIALRIQRMEQLIDNLLTYARAGRKDAECLPLNLSAMLDEVLELVQLPDGFRVERDFQLPTLLAAKVPLETVLRNLISNAVKHHDRSEGVIRVASCEQNNMCLITITDDGPGVPDSSLERIFRLFQTLSSSERNGTGIGLSVSRRLVETHGGTIAVENNLNQRGLTFKVCWPRFVRTDLHD